MLDILVTSTEKNRHESLVFRLDTHRPPCEPTLTQPLRPSNAGLGSPLIARGPCGALCGGMYIGHDGSRRDRGVSAASLARSALHYVQTSDVRQANSQTVALIFIEPLVIEEKLEMLHSIPSEADVSRASVHFGNHLSEVWSNHHIHTNIDV
ncbi:hypothetical protein GN956_G9450 [Arapaima gigas]